jgi:hypothetical protein
MAKEGSRRRVVLKREATKMAAAVRTNNNKGRSGNQDRHMCFVYGSVEQ